MPIVSGLQIPAALPPSGAAGGGLTGSYPNPTLAGGVNPNDQVRLNGQGIVASTLMRGVGVNVVLPTSGRMIANAVGLTAGQVVTSVAWWSAVAAAVVTRIQWALYTSALALVASTANDVTLFAAAENETKALTAPYTVPTTGLYYLALLEVATTPGSLSGFSSNNRNEQGPLPNGSYIGWEQDALATLPNPAVISFPAGALFHADLI